MFLGNDCYANLYHNNQGKYVRNVHKDYINFSALKNWNVNEIQWNIQEFGHKQEATEKILSIVALKHVAW